MGVVNVFLTVVLVVAHLHGHALDVAVHVDVGRVAVGVRAGLALAVLDLDHIPDDLIVVLAVFFAQAERRVQSLPGGRVQLARTGHAAGGIFQLVADGQAAVSAGQVCPGLRRQAGAAHAVIVVELGIFLGIGRGEVVLIPLVRAAGGHAPVGVEDIVLHGQALLHRGGLLLVLHGENAVFKVGAAVVAVTSGQERPDLIQNAVFIPVVVLGLKLIDLGVQDLIVLGGLGLFQIVRIADGQGHHSLPVLFGGHGGVDIGAVFVLVHREHRARQGRARIRVYLMDGEGDGGGLGLLPHGVQAGVAGNLEGVVRLVVGLAVAVGVPTGKDHIAVGERIGQHSHVVVELILAGVGIAGVGAVVGVVSNAVQVGDVLDLAVQVPGPGAAGHIVVGAVGRMEGVPLHLIQVNPPVVLVVDLLQRLGYGVLVLVIDAVGLALEIPGGLRQVQLDGAHRPVAVRVDVSAGGVLGGLNVHVDRLGAGLGLLRLAALHGDAEVLHGPPQIVPIVVGHHGRAGPHAFQRHGAVIPAVHDLHRVPARIVHSPLMAGVPEGAAPGSGELDGLAHLDGSAVLGVGLLGGGKAGHHILCQLLRGLFAQGSRIVRRSLLRDFRRLFLRNFRRLLRGGALCGLRRLFRRRALCGLRRLFRRRALHGLQHHGLRCDGLRAELVGQGRRGQQSHNHHDGQEQCQGPLLRPG